MTNVTNMTIHRDVPTVSVIVPVWNNSRQLRLCIDALVKQTYPRALFEILVVDNGSTEDISSVVGDFEGVVLLSEPRPGSYVARNTAVRVAQAPYLAFTDSDCIPDPGWLAAAMAVAQSTPNLGLVAGNIQLFDEDGDGWQVCRDYETMFSFQQNPELGHCMTANWLSPRAVITELGGFAEQMKSGADKDMALRIRASGKAVVQSREMLVMHPFRATLKATLNKRRRLNGGHWDRTRSQARLLTVQKNNIGELSRRLKRIASSKLGITQKTKLAGLSFYLMGISSLEYIRLAAGGKPVR